MGHHRPPSSSRRPWILPLVLLLACAANPVTRQSQVMLVSEEEEARIGAEAAREIQREFGYYDRLPGLRAYVNEVGRKLAARTPRQNVNYRFEVLDSPVINAFALPGGYVYVTRGILARMSSEDELAAVLGHELTHVAARHTASQLSRQRMAGFGLGVLSILNPDLARSASGLVDASLALAFLGYSRDLEAQADEFGITYMEEAGYTPRGAAKMFRMFLAIEDGEPGAMERFLMSHPPTRDRLAYAERRIAEFAQSHPKAAQKPLLRDRFLNRIEGLDLGQSRGDRLLAGGVLTLKDVRVALAIPEGYEANLSPPEGQALLFRDAKTASGTVRRTVGVEVLPLGGKGREGFINAYLARIQTPHEVLNADTLKTPEGLDLSLRALRLTPREGDLRALLGFAFRGGEAVVVYGYTPAAVFPEAREEFRGILKSLRFPTDAELAAVTGPKLRLVTARAGDTWESLALREYGKPGPAPRLAAFNGVFNPQKPPEAGMRIKVPERRFLRGEG